MSTNNKNSYLILAWLVCGLGAVFYMYEYFLRISPSVMENALRAHFNLSATGFGFLSAVYYYAYVPMQLPAGIMMDRFGPKRLLTVACTICVIGTFMFCGTSWFFIAGVGRFLVGLGSAFAFVGVLKLATLWLPENKLAMVAGMAAALGTIGAMIGDNLLGSMVNHLGWQETVNLSAVIGVGLIVLLWFGIRDQKRFHNEHSALASVKRYLIDLGIILRSKQVWINGVYGCLVYLPTTVFAELWGIPYLHHAHGLTQEAASLANSILFLGFTIGAPLMGFISDKIKRRKLPMLIGATGAALLMSVVIYVPNLSAHSINVLMFLLGLFYSVQSIVFAVGRELSPREAAGTAIATTNMIVMLGAMFLQPLVGRLLDWSLRMRQPDVSLMVVDKMEKLYTAADYQFALSIIPLGIFIAVILTFFLRETYAHARC